MCQISGSLCVLVSQRTLGNCHRCLDVEAETGTTLPSLSCCGRARLEGEVNARIWADFFWREKLSANHVREQLSTAFSKLTILTNTIHQKQWKRDAVILVSWRKCAFAQCANVAVTVQTSAGAATQMWALMNLEHSIFFQAHLSSTRQ